LKNDLHGTFTPELFHLHAPAIDMFCASSAYKPPVQAVVHFREGITMVNERHRLSTLLYKSEISFVGDRLWKFRDQRFSFEQLRHAALRLEVHGKIESLPLYDLLAVLFSRNVIQETSVDF